MYNTGEMRDFDPNTGIAYVNTLGVTGFVTCAVVTIIILGLCLWCVWDCLQLKST